MRGRTAVLAGLILGGLLAGVACTSLQVHTYVPRSADVARYRTYAWAPANAFETGDPRLDNNTLFIERLRGAVERQLKVKGWTLAPGNDADLVIHLHARIDQRLDLRDAVTPERTSEDAGGGPVVYDAGTLVIDFFEARTNTLMWRGWAEGAVEGVIDNQAQMNQTIDEAVARILVTFPIRS